MMFCIHCPMIFNPDMSGKLATDERGGVYTGWILPPNELPSRPHVHDLATCARYFCDEYADASDGTFCSDYCRERDYVESGA